MELFMAGFSNREISQVTGQKNYTIIAQYKRKLEMMTRRNGEMQGAGITRGWSRRRRDWTSSLYR